MEDKLYTILQICDSAFPTGGFSHSNGAEAAIQNQYLKDEDSLKIFILSGLENSGSLYIPFVRAAHEAILDSHKIKELDSLHNASLLNHVANRASKNQGRAFLSTSSNVFCLPEIVKLKALVDDEQMHGHLAIVFAVVCSVLGIPALEVGKMFLFNTLRTAIASLVRLGKLGAVLAQCYQFEVQKHLDDILIR